MNRTQTKPVRGRAQSRLTPLERIEDFLQRQRHATDRAEIDAQLTRVRMALFGCAPK